MPVKVEVFSSPTCAECPAVKQLVKEVIDELGKECFKYMEVDITINPMRARLLRVFSAPSVAVNSRVMFRGMPKREDVVKVLKEILNQKQNYSW